MNKKVLTALTIGAFGLIGIIILQASQSNQQQVTSTEDTNDITPDLTISVSILPQEFFVEKITGDKARVKALVPPGASPELFEPTPQDLATLAESEILFTLGKMEFEVANLDRIREANPNLTVVDTSAGITLRTIEDHSHGDEDHDDHKDDHSEEVDGHDHSGEDPHIWLDPLLVIEQVNTIYEVLIEVRPEYTDEFRANKEAFVQELQDLDDELKATLSDVQGKTMLVYHPAFGYFTDRYGLTQKYFEIDGKEPSIEKVQAIIDEAKEEGITTVFVQQQFPTETAETIAREIGGSVVEVDPLERDYFANLRNIAQAIIQN